MNERLKTLNQRVGNLVAARSAAENGRKRALDRVCEETGISNTIKASIDLARVVAVQTQAEFERRISGMADMAVSTVFEGKYKFQVEFIPKRNNSEAYAWLIDKDGNKLSPMDSNGGTIVDIIALAMRVTMWKLASPQTRNTIILDEPMRCVSRDKIPRCGQMLKTLADKLNVQFIVITHFSEFEEVADNVIKL